MDDSNPEKLIRPQDLQAKYEIGRSTYYKRLHYLDIKAKKDNKKRAYLTVEQVAQLDQLHSYIQKQGTMIGFKTSQLVDKKTNPSKKPQTYNNIVNCPKAPSPTAIAP